MGRSGAALRLVWVSVIVGTLSGCMTPPQHFTVISTKSVNLSDLTVDPEHAKGAVEGESCSGLFASNSGYPSVATAVNKALSNSTANFLYSATVESSGDFAGWCLTVKGESYESY